MSRPTTDARAHLRRAGQAGGYEGGQAYLAMRDENRTGVKRQRFPDDLRIDYDRSPLTDIEKARLWAWACRGESREVDLPPLLLRPLR